MSKRKTVEIATVKALANQFFSESGDAERNGRRMLHSFVGSLLHETGQYKGFGYIEGKGIIRDATGNNNHTFPDDSRMFFY